MRKTAVNVRTVHSASISLWAGILVSMSSTSSLVDGPGAYSEDRLCSQWDDEDDVVTMGSLTKTQRKHIRNKLPFTWHRLPGHTRGSGMEF